MSIQKQEDTESSETDDSEHSDADELPGPLYRPDTQTRLPSLAGGPTKREWAIKIRLPRDSEKREALPDDIQGVLAMVLRDVCNDPDLDHTETLMLPGRYGFESILIPQMKNMDDRSSTQATLEDYECKVSKLGIAKLKKAIKRRYPENIIAEVGKLRLDPVGASDVTTSRLYLREDANPTHAGVMQEEPLEVLFDKLRENRDPFIYQVIVQKSKGRFKIVVRLATYHPNDNYTGDLGFARLVDKGKPTDPARVFSPSNILSNHDPAMAKKYWNTTHERKVDGTEAYSVTCDYSTVTYNTTRTAVRKKAEKVKEIILGKEEHRRLMTGDTTSDLICENEFNRYGRIPLFESQLKQFVRVYTKKWDVNPWKNVPGRDAPVFYSVESISVETPADFGVGEGLQDAAPADTEVKNKGSPQHASLEEFSKRTFTEGGDEIAKVPQDTSSIPDLRLKTADGTIQTLDLQVESDVVPVECESTNVTRASNTLINAERAHAADRHVIFVYQQSDVERGYKHLKQPYKRTVDGGVTLYTQTSNVETLDGRTLVRQGLSSTTWILKGTTLIAKDGEEVMATGPASDDVATFDWDCYYYQKDGDSYRVETADGDLVESYGSKEAFKADWTRISQPHIPVAHSYLNFVTVTYRDRDTGQLQVYDPRPDWESTDRTESQKAGYKRFFDEHIVERDGPELTYDELDAVFSSWFAGHSQFDPPVRSVIGGWHPEEFKDAKTGGTGNEYQYFDGFSLRIAPITDSPHQQGPPADFDPEETVTDQHEDESA